VVDEASTCEAPLDSSVGSVGVVLGATLDLADYGINTGSDPGERALPVLAPGFGHQGARIEDATRIFGSFASALLANESRSILSGGADGLGRRIGERAASIAAALYAGGR